MAVSSRLYKRIQKNGRRRGLHIVIVETALGHYLSPGNEVHHFDGDPTNNSNSNLVVCEDKAYHKLLHVRQRVLQAGGDPNTDRICSRCKAVKLKTLFAEPKSRNICKECNNLLCREWYHRQKKEAA